MPPGARRRVAVATLEPDESALASGVCVGMVVCADAVAGRPSRIAPSAIQMVNVVERDPCISRDPRV